MPGGPRLPAPDYVDGSKALQRRLRQLGAGSLAAGFQALAGAEEVQREVAAMLGCKPEVRAGGLGRCQAGGTEAGRERQRRLS